MELPIPVVSSNDNVIDRVAACAIGDLVGNVGEWTDLRGRSRPTLLAGFAYDRPWTRDAAINSWNVVSMLWPELARSTLEAVLVDDHAGLRIGGQYWDAIIWTVGAWHHYLATNDVEFATLALEASVNSLRHFDETELDPDDGLYRGGACFADGISAYPDRYLNPAWESGIENWSDLHPEMRHAIGEGFPAKVLSTNCLYYQAWRVLTPMAHAIGIEPAPEWADRAAQLRTAIRTHFVDESTGDLAYLVDADGQEVRQEGLGYAFAVLFGVVDRSGAGQLVRRSTKTAHGLPTLWPDYERYRAYGYGRHGATVWPHVNAFWADACSRSGDRAQAWSEIELLAAKVARDGHFAEIYHPVTGEQFGGVQENAAAAGIEEWASRPRQSWCASGYWRMLLATIFGLELTEAGPSLDPWLPDRLDRFELHGLTIRGAVVSLAAERTSEGVKAAIRPSRASR